MVSSNVTLTKDKKVTSEQRIFLKTALLQLGVSPRNNGFQLFVKVISLVYKLDMITINLNKICNILALRNKLTTPKAIYSELKYAFYNINTKKLFANYEKVFGIELDTEYFSIKNLINDFVDLLESME